MPYGFARTPATGAEPPEPLTLDSLRAAMDAVRDAQPRRCGATEPHVVHPRAVGWTSCADCLSPVFVEGRRDSAVRRDPGVVVFAPSEDVAYARRWAANLRWAVKAGRLRRVQVRENRYVLAGQFWVVDLRKLWTPAELPTVLRPTEHRPSPLWHDGLLIAPVLRPRDAVLIAGD